MLVSPYCPDIDSLPQDVDDELVGEPAQVGVRHAGMDEHVVEYVDQPGEAEGGPGDDDHGVADSGGELVFLSINIVDYQFFQVQQLYTSGNAEAGSRNKAVAENFFFSMTDPAIRDIIRRQYRNCLVKVDLCLLSANSSDLSFLRRIL